MVNRNVVLSRLDAFFKSPKTSLFLGLVLLTSGILEMTDSVIERLLNIEIGVHHGIIVFALGHIISNLLHIAQGIEYIEKYQDETGHDQNR